MTHEREPSARLRCPRAFRPGRPRVAWLGLPALLGLTFVLACRRPTEIEPAIDVRAASADSTHIDLGFRESLDPTAMTSLLNYRVWTPGDSGRIFAVLGVTIPDSIRGRSVRLETSPVPDGIRLLVRVERVRLVTGASLDDAPITVDLVSGLSYRKDIQPLLAERCNTCHAAAAPAASYATDSYFALFGSGVSPPGNLIPGDASSLLVRKSLPSGSMFWTGDLEFIEAEEIRNWVVAYQARQ